jgi:hypothetical protein
MYYCFTVTVLICGAPSLTRGRVCLFYMLLALASAVFLGSESLRSLYHILLFQFRDFPFRRLLRLAGSRWRYSTPPPHGSLLTAISVILGPLIIFRHGPHRKHVSRVRLRVHWPITSAGRGADHIENTFSPVVAKPNDELLTWNLSSREIVYQPVA